MSRVWSQAAASVVGPSRVDDRDAFDQQRVGGDAERQRVSRRRVAHRRRQPIDRGPERGMLGRIERPAPAGRDKCPGNVPDTTRELGGDRRGAALRRSHSHIIARMRTVDVIRRKRDGGPLRRDEIEHFVAGVTDRHHSRLPGRRAADGDRAPRHDRRRDRAADRCDGALRACGCDFDGIRGRAGRQAQHRRRRRQDLADPRAAGGGLRRDRADDVGPRRSGTPAAPSTSSSRFPGSAPTCRSTSFRDAVSRIGGALIGQTAGDRAGRPPALCPARRHRHRREHPADLGVDHEQEDRRGHRRAGARREGRRRGVHEDR